MLPSKIRIKRSDFKLLKEKGFYFDSKNISLKIYKNSENINKFTFICSRKVEKKAVLRNLLRRRGYSIVRDYLKKLDIGFYFIFSFKKGVSSLSFVDLKKEIENLFVLAKVLK